MTPDAELACWIDELRERVDRGDLDNHAPVELGYGTCRFPAARIVRIMLTDCADLQDPADARDEDAAWHDERRRALQDEFRRLRELVG